MAKVENTTDGNRDLTVNVGEGKSVTVTIPKASGDAGSRVNGSVEIDDALLAKAMSDVVVKAWFDEGQLLVRTKLHRTAEPEKSETKTEHGHKSR